MATDNCGFCGKPIVLTQQAKECKCGATNRELPTLTCSEVVERLATEAYSIETENDDSTFDCEKATEILHSWRERRVQELEEALRWAFGYIPRPTLIKGQNDKHYAAYEKAENALANSEWREQIRKGAKHD